ncbi:DUF1795 domain-containing protein [Xenorhabdus bovienii]|uniref:DUF1795 domain-containing protein n=1 Tax=Xenorhabdus bovienii TaxID=40576 RepID=UPI00237CAE98|nr:DUF1795 domain-containing protein [Xenorhabdus bovienii]MDE1475754.1 DUF1795 domain-containing protein [Xenorhabdus bovienii]MDE1483659.1 DUF1795 domain-containing protein [Xenorhabdus bovienii]MDE1488281.1 DUF1795 domain-containing protein [Xenorhabdus bovienii]MDE9430563.1 DUF1795 domain-containing protein [Xenorhabdus bovienii]MDE9437933.1 DUF1795 domain-containing protein [Xenorhabdus bovienii]
MSAHPYQMNEGTLTIPANWRDESMHVFILPDDSGVNLVINRSAVPLGTDPEAFYAQTLTQFVTHLPDYQEHQRLQIELSGEPAWRLDYQWQSPEGEMHQTVVMQIRGSQLLAFNLTSPEPFNEGQRHALLDVISSFHAV